MRGVNTEAGLDGPRRADALSEPIAATQSFEPPSHRIRKRILLLSQAGAAPSCSDAPTQRGGPRPITQSSIKAITGDYAKADDNEAMHRPTARRITRRLPLAEIGVAQIGERAARRDEAPEKSAATPQVEGAHPATLRRAWLQGAFTGALVLTLAWLGSLILRAS